MYIAFFEVFVGRESVLIEIMFAWDSLEITQLVPILKARLFLLLHLGDLKRSTLYNVKLHWLSKTIDF